MREFKYRAWHKEKRILVRVIDLYLSDGTVHLPIETDITDEYWWDSTTWDLKNVELMQYTGLKDKNGTEIYEGDIIECLREGNGFVTKRHGAYGIETRFGFYPFIEIHGEFEVIGNIYEHPHLIQRK